MMAQLLLNNLRIWQAYHKRRQDFFTPLMVGKVKSTLFGSFNIPAPLTLMVLLLQLIEVQLLMKVRGKVVHKEFPEPNRYFLKHLLDVFRTGDIISDDTLDDEISGRDAGSYNTPGQKDVCFIALLWSPFKMIHVAVDLLISLIVHEEISLYIKRSVLFIAFNTKTDKGLLFANKPGRLERNAAGKIAVQGVFMFRVQFPPLFGRESVTEEDDVWYRVWIRPVTVFIDVGFRNVFYIHLRSFKKPLRL